MKKITVLIVFLLSRFLSAQTPVFYGTTINGGSIGYGTIIKFDPATNTESVVWNFGIGTDGVQPWGDLTYDPTNRLFYAMTPGGGTTTKGTVISFNPSTNAEAVVWSFGSGSDGTGPQGSLVYDATSGLFYGMTYYGGISNAGTIVKFDPTANAESVVWSFTNGSDGGEPQEGSFVYDPANGLFYGVTPIGGSHSDGAIISFNPSTNAESAVWSFGGGGDGINPYGELVYDATNGFFYGMTQFGGAHNKGAIIKFNPTTNTEAVVWSFGVGSDGFDPRGELVYHAGNGLFYGTTFEGGSNSVGTIISFNPTTNAEAVVWNFGNGIDGKYSWGHLVYDANNGLFYGLAETGGSNARGVIFSFNPATNTDSVVWSFGSGADGYNPRGSFVSYNSTASSVNEINSPTAKMSAYPNPGNGHFTIQSSVVSGQSSVEVYTVFGEKVYSQLSTLNPQLSINLNQPNGIYLYRVLNEDGSLLGEGKLVIQR